MTVYAEARPAELVSAGYARWAPPTRREIARAVPTGSRRAHYQSAWLRAVLADQELAGRRSDFSANVARVARILARHMDWHRSTARPGRDRVCQLAGISATTFKRIRRWLELGGYLGTVREGWSPILRAAALVEDGDPNAAPVYVLAIPRQKPVLPAPIPDPAISGPLTAERSEVVIYPARGTARTGQGQGRKARLAAADAATHSRRHAEVLRKGPGKTITDGWIGYLMRPFLAARWSPGDLRAALEHKPTGERHTGMVRNVADPRAWLAWRLSHWIGPDGKPMRSPSQERAAQAAELADLQERDRAARAELAARAVDPAPRAAAIREALGWTGSAASPARSPGEKIRRPGGRWQSSAPRSPRSTSSP